VTSRANSSSASSRAAGERAFEAAALRLLGAIASGVGERVRADDHLVAALALSSEIGMDPPADTL